MPRPSFTATVKPPVHTRSVTEIMAESASLEERIIKTESQRLGCRGGGAGRNRNRRHGNRHRGEKRERETRHSKTESKPDGNSQSWQTFLHLL